MKVRQSETPGVVPGERGVAGGGATWHGDVELKRGTLAQLATQRDAPVPHFEALEVGGEAIPIFGWTGTPSRLDLAAEALGLPADLLELGWCLFEGFPDCDEAVADEIALKIDFLTRIPVGVDATQVAAHFVAGCLRDRLGSFATPTLATDRALIQDVGRAVFSRSGSELAELGARVEAWGRSLVAELRAVWQGHETAESLRLQREWRTMDATSAACKMLVDPRAVRRVVTGSLTGAKSDEPWDVDKDFEPLVARLSALLAELG